MIPTFMRFSSVCSGFEWSNDATTCNRTVDATPQSLILFFRNFYNQLAKIFAFEKSDKGFRRVLQSLHDIFAILHFSCIESQFLDNVTALLRTACNTDHAAAFELSNLTGIQHDPLVNGEFIKLFGTI